jgi:predicted ATP-grasp superfamily ATP-dependent carboligase
MMAPHRHPGPLAGKLRILHRLTAWTCVIVVVAAYACFPTLRRALGREDLLLDAPSVVLFAAAAVIGGLRFFDRGLGPWFYGAIPLAGLAGTLLELQSAATRPPLADAIAARRWLVAGLLLLVGAAVGGGRFSEHRSAGWTGWRRLLLYRPPLEYAIITGGLLGIVLFLDLAHSTHPKLTLVGELAELEVALALVFGALSLSVPDPHHASAPVGSGGLVPAIVSSAGSPAAVTIVQSLGPHGIPIHALSNLDHPACLYSRYTATCHITPSGRGGGPRHDNVQEPDSLLTYLEEHVARGVLFPGTDANIRFLARHKRRLADAGFRLCIPDAEVLAHAADKSDLAAFCERHGFPAPRTVVVDSAEDLHRVAELQFPVVFKGVFMKNHRFVERRTELEAAYAAFAARFAGKSDDRRAVAQEWVPGPPERFAKLYVVCDGEGRVVAHHTLRRLRVQVRKDGSQGDTLAAKTELVPELIERWLPFFSVLRWVGVASMECKYDERDRQYKIIEINPRPWAILKISVDCGVDVPLLYYRLAQGERLEPQTRFEENRYYIRLLWGNIDVPEPWRVAGMLFTRRITLREVLGVYRELWTNRSRLSIDVGRLRDPWPTIACLYYYGVRYFSRWF